MKKLILGLLVTFFLVPAIQGVSIQAHAQPPVCENTVFLTNDIYTTDLIGEAQSNFPVACAGVTTGLEGADCICQQLADAEGLDGTYKAWLSDSMDSPSTTFTQSICPYGMVNGVQVADNWTDLTDGDIDTCIRIDETGVALVGVCQNSNTNGNFSVLTNTLKDGTTKGTQNCGDWTINNQNLPLVHGGLFDHSNSGWTDQGDNSWNCNNPGRHLYCFEQSDAPTVVTPIPTLSEWGLITMAGILGIVGFMILRRRKETA
jgi:hypothetical protein